MEEIKVFGTGTFSVTASVLPTKDLTALDIKKIAERERQMDVVLKECTKDHVWLKFNKGINKGTIVQAQVVDIGGKRPENCNKFMFSSYTGNPDNGYLRYCIEKKPKNKDFQFAKSRLIPYISVPYHINMMKMKEGIIFPGFQNSDVMTSVSLLVDYDGDEVFCLDTELRPETFEDRLGQDVGIGDLVVVACLYGAGLDVCVVKGYSDPMRVVLESCQDGSLERIPLEDNATLKIMKMPMNLKDTALMMKLAGPR